MRDNSVYFDPTTTLDIEWVFRHLKSDVRYAKLNNGLITDNMNWCVIFLCLCVASVRASGSMYQLLFTYCNLFTQKSPICTYMYIYLPISNTVRARASIRLNSWSFGLNITLHHVRNSFTATINRYQLFKVNYYQKNIFS